MAEEGIELLAEHMRAPHYVDGDSHFVRTLSLIHIYVTSELPKYQTENI